MDFKIGTRIKATAQEIYNAWLDSQSHTAMTGGEAIVSAKTGEKFTAWDGYIQGVNITLEPYRRIVQSWRTTEFTAEEEDSRLEILLDESGRETTLTLIHTNLPDHGEQYRQGWVDNYFQPMKEYFES